MIGYYVHHQGSGHLHRALTVAPLLPEPVTGLSSLRRPDGWPGEWLQLPRDDRAAQGYGTDADVTAGGQLHWVPLHDDGLRERTHLLSAWIERARPSALVVDQSVEICVAARLHGVPVVGLTAPGRRDDAAHALGFGLCTALVGAWPDGVTDQMLPGVPEEIRHRFTAVGACSRLPVATDQRPARPDRSDGDDRRHVVVMAGNGGDGFTRELLDDVEAQAPDWRWTVLSRRLGSWHEDPAAVLAAADVAVIHPGQNSLAEVAALRVPAVVVPQPRPFDEQRTTADVLRAPEWPAVVLDELPSHGWSDILAEASQLDGEQWARWCDGRAPHRIAAVLRRVLTTRQAA